MPIIIPANSAASGGYDVDNSLRFTDGSSDYLNRTPSSASNRRTFTISTWIKLNLQFSGSSTTSSIFSAWYADSTVGHFVWRIDSDGKIGWSQWSNDSYSNRRLRDESAWYHCVLAVDTTQGTASNRIKLYINNEQITSFASGPVYPSQNEELPVNNNNKQVIGANSYSSTANYYNGYMAETVLIDGSALAPTSFGEFDEDSEIWKPIDVSGLTFGTNGFYLDFENSGALGADVSGNTNNFTVNNLTAVDQSTDTCTTNFATLNPLFKQDGVFSEGNLAYTIAASDFDSGVSTFGASSGKWYFETKITAIASGTTRNSVGICDARDGNYIAENEFGQPGSAIVGDTVGYTGNSSTAVFKNNSSEYTGTQYTTNDILCCAVDLDNGAVYFRKNNGSWLNSGNPESGASKTGAVTITTGETYLFGNTAYAGSAFAMNFGSPPYAISSSNTDGNGYGNFEYAVPSGYYSLNTKNLSEYG